MSDGERRWTRDDDEGRGERSPGRRRRRERERVGVVESLLGSRRRQNGARRSRPDVAPERRVERSRGPRDAPGRWRTRNAACYPRHAAPAPRTRSVGARPRRAGGARTSSRSPCGRRKKRKRAGQIARGRAGTSSDARARSRRARAGETPRTFPRASREVRGADGACARVARASPVRRHPPRKNLSREGWAENSDATGRPGIARRAPPRRRRRQPRGVRVRAIYLPRAEHRSRARRELLAAPAARAHVSNAPESLSGLGRARFIGPIDDGR